MSTARVAKLSSEDLERLRVACGTSVVDPTRSLFGPGSVTWKVNREAAILLGGGCALLLQVAHPLVAAGVAAHSQFKRQPLQRLWRTLDLMLTITFADAARAVEAVRAIERVHARVHGTLEAPVGPFPRGTRYDANDPALLLWVHATLVDTALRVYEMMFGRLSGKDRAAYYEESKIVARLLGIPAAQIPPTPRAFREYMNGMVRGDVLAVGDAARDIAGSILRPPLPIGLQQVFQIPNVVTIGLLPPELRARYGFEWGTAREMLLRLVVSGTQLLVPRLPAAVRVLRHARHAAALGVTRV